MLNVAYPGIYSRRLGSQSVLCFSDISRPILALIDLFQERYHDSIPDCYNLSTDFYSFSVNFNLLQI